MNRLAEIVRKFSQGKVLIVGDMAADRYVFGRTARISREAPVVILEYERELIKPGQGANAAFNVISLGGEVFPVGVVGDDREGEALVESFKKAGVCTDGLVVLKGQNTTVKTRIWARGHHTAYQQVVRVDKSMREHVDGVAKRKLMEIIKDAAKDCDALLVSDYGLGVVSEDVRELVLSMHLPVIVDSRYNVIDFTGATIATPNEEEAAYALSLAGPQELKLPEHGWELKKRLQSQALLITQGSFGMSLFDEEYHHIPVYGEDEVADVTGAGDTVAAAVALSLAVGAKFLEAAHIANRAAGLAVRRMGTAQVEQEELLATFGDEDEESA